MRVDKSIESRPTPVFVYKGILFIQVYNSIIILLNCDRIVHDTGNPLILEPI